MNYYEKFTKDIAITGITNLVVALRGLILLPILSKTLGTAGYGIWAQVTVTLFLVSCFSTLNLPASLTRFLAAERDRGKISEGFSMVAVIGLGSSLLMAGILFLLSDLFSSVLLDDPEAVKQQMLRQRDEIRDWIQNETEQILDWRERLQDLTNLYQERFPNRGEPG